MVLGLRDNPDVMQIRIFVAYCNCNTNQFESVTEHITILFVVYTFYSKICDKSKFNNFTEVNLLWQDILISVVCKLFCWFSHAYNMTYDLSVNTFHRSLFLINIAASYKFFVNKKICQT